VRAFNALDAKQILEFTKDRLHFLSSSHQDKLQLRGLDEGASAVKDFEAELGLNDSNANLLRSASQPEDQNFDAILNEHVSDFMGQDGAASADAQTHEGFLQLMHTFLQDDRNLLQINEAIRTASDDHAALFGEAADMSHLISLSLDSHEAVPAKKRDMRQNRKFQEFLLATDRQVNMQVAGQRKRLQTQAIESQLGHATEQAVLAFQPKKAKDTSPFELPNALGKEQLFDDFLVDLFSNSLDLRKLGAGMPLDKSLMLHSVRKQSVERLLQTESAAGGMLSNLQVRDGSATLHSANLLSHELRLKNAEDFQPDFDNGNPYEIEPLNYDLADGGVLEPHSNPDHKKAGLGDFPSLRDLETSNGFTKTDLLE